MMPRPDRYHVDLPVNCSTRDAFVSNRVMNIGRGGLFIASAEPFPLQAEVDLAFELPDSGATIQVKGRVIWNYDVAKGSARIVPGSGIKFIDMSPGDRALLEECLGRLASARAQAPGSQPGDPRPPIRH